ncbi:response regulator [Rhodobacteraceae bacterium CCMM004]|nr:response regulator [Rhodobacteraceae bacterium CCMM004]
MKVLIVGNEPELVAIWARSLARAGCAITHVLSQDEAIAALQHRAYHVVILDLSLSPGSALAVADFAGYRWPDARVIPVTSSTFFSDGSVFQHIANACTSIGKDTPADDIAAIVEHYGTQR